MGWSTVGIVHCTYWCVVVESSCVVWCRHLTGSVNDRDKTTHILRTLATQIQTTNIPSYSTRHHPRHVPLCSHILSTPSITTVQPSHHKPMQTTSCKSPSTNHVYLYPQRSYEKSSNIRSKSARGSKCIWLLFSTLYYVSHLRDSIQRLWIGMYIFPFGRTTLS